ncbi:hypothetical protein MKW98_020025 [Papaver atlanticum]|uniref:Uncharacterized protein n=1 Tax=Papaver atlanticum TaxID=357466 RepID=A0AAD4S2P6_9MAGN|nr:hypothetical protein MKW98_020025 [Papaver atlanticum]
MAQSPGGFTVASAAGDETLRFWNVFGTPELAKPAPKANPEPFAHFNRICVMNYTSRVLCIAWHIWSMV